MGSVLPGRSEHTAQQAARSITAMQLCLAEKRKSAPTPPPELLSSIASVHAALAQQGGAVQAAEPLATAQPVDRNVTNRNKRTARKVIA